MRTKYKSEIRAIALVLGLSQPMATVITLIVPITNTIVLATETRRTWVVRAIVLGI